MIHLACQKNLKHFLIFLVHLYFSKAISQVNAGEEKEVEDLLDAQNDLNMTPFEIAYQHANIEICVILHNLKQKHYSISDWVNT